MTDSVAKQTLELITEAWNDGINETDKAEGIEWRLEDISYYLENGNLTEALAEAISNIAADDTENTDLYANILSQIQKNHPDLVKQILMGLNHLSAGKVSNRVVSELKTKLGA